MINRLHLDFQLETATERREFLNEYLKRTEFQLKPLSEEELEMCGNYLLWGKDEDGKNSVQKKIVEIKTKKGTWDKKEDESLDALLKQPTFNEAQTFNTTGAPTKITREVFSRSKALKEAPPQLIPIFKDLFRQIDKLDLTLNYYDLAHGKRKNPPREELLKQFTPEEQLQLQEEASSLNQYKYLKMRHLLVELRRQQFTLKDSYSSTIQRHTVPSTQFLPTNISFENEVVVFPFGVNAEKKNKISSLIFRDDYDPNSYTEEELKLISKYIWEKKELFSNITSNQFIIDFRNLEHVYNIFQLYYDLEDESFKKELESETDSLLNTLKFYIKKANLSDIHREILELKIQKKRNQDISSYINQKYNKSYTSNYISTIFRQKIIREINEAAQYHEELINNIFFPENFKKCNDCGEILLCSTHNFVKKSRSKDGYANRCKRCDKKIREQAKNGKK